MRRRSKGPDVEKYNKKSGPIYNEIEKVESSDLVDGGGKKKRGLSNQGHCDGIKKDAVPIKDGGQKQSRGPKTKR